MNLDREQFRAWLLSQPDGVCVGNAIDACSCPVACWLSGVTGQAVMVGDENWRFVEGDEVYDVPAWVKEFVREVDRARLNEAITKEWALQIVEGC
jgi:hypothetical protein